MSIDIDLVDQLAAKRQLVSDLKGMLTLRLEFGDALEHKAIEVFKYSSALLAIIAGIGISRQNIQGHIFLGVGYFCLLIVYGYHAFCMYKVLRPSVYNIAPGIPSNSLPYDE